MNVYGMAAVGSEAKVKIEPHQFGLSRQCPLSGEERKTSAREEYFRV
jgi:hypothetical protein